ncbi:MAG: chemotaxis protein CheW [Gemmatimonadaceae bacterium]|nr:chemotaxis protein CheW [Gemmatimonadaceae bacterium]MBA3645894.1 chemotaxis protein CheW [Gemmatimonadaceae bacterium]
MERETSVSQAILSERARVLAIPLLEDDQFTAGDDLDIMIFTIGDERLGLPLSSIVAIAPAGAVTPLPLGVAPVYGVTAWRGRPLTVLALAAMRNTGNANLIVLGNDQRAAVGLLVDAVEETRPVARSGLSAAHPGPRRELAIGLTDDGVLVLDAETLLHTPPRES